jgi:hypothetical protein
LSDFAWKVVNMGIAPKSKPWVRPLGQLGLAAGGSRSFSCCWERLGGWIHCLPCWIWIGFLILPFSISSINSPASAFADIRGSWVGGQVYLAAVQLFTSPIPTLLRQALLGQQGSSQVLLG